VGHARLADEPLLALLLVACGGGHAPSAPHTEDTGGGEGSRSPIIGAAACADAAVGVQVLGSGGPIPDDDRASAAYLVWVDGHARALIDAGGGLVQRFGASGAHIEDLDVVALTHLHVDHAAGLPALLKGGYFSARERPLPILGPVGNDAFPPVDALLERTVGPDGAFRYLHGYVDGQDPFALEVRALSGDEEGPPYAGPNLSIDARRVRHGNVPALGFLVTVGESRIGFTGDQSAAGRDAFATMVEGAELLIAHHAVSEDADEQLRTLHSTPSELGTLAARAHVERLVLSHNMRRALDDRERGLSAIRDAYEGPVDIASDLDCFVLR